MPIAPALLPFWQAFAAATGKADVARFYEAFAFGDSEALADELASLVLAGAKRATAGAIWSYEADGQRLPAPGDLSIVTNWAGEPLCVIETTRVDLVPFNQVSAEFAAAEGEGDASLASWREGHRAYFTRECVASGRVFSEDMLVSCERFEVVFQPSSGPESDAISQIQITTHDDHPVAESVMVDEGIGAANLAAAPLHEVMPLACFAHGADGVVLGGAVGRRWGHCCELQQLWVMPTHRRQGIAKKLMAAFEQQAQAHGCTSCFLETFSFQAPGFYGGLGYAISFENKAFPHGIVKYHMVKALEQPALT